MLTSGRDTFSVPGKTFLVGEYVALDNGPSILISTAPRFTLRALPSQAATDQLKHGLPFAPMSPAGLYLSQHQAEFSAFQFQFEDLHSGKGGLGASSAQFALLWAFREHLIHDRDLSKPELLPWADILTAYRQCAWDGRGVAPSGADVVSQLHGGITFFDGGARTAEGLKWDFKELGFTLIRTGQKLATHEHLKNAGQAPHSSLRTVVMEAQKAFKMNDDMRLIESVQACAHVLRESNLTAETTLGLLESMRTETELFYAVKGCGALGADVILALHEKTKSPQIADWVKKSGLEICGSLETLTNGIESHAIDER